MRNRQGDCLDQQRAGDYSLRARSRHCIHRKPGLDNWARVFAAYDDIDYEVRDLDVTVGGDVAFVRSLNRLSGTLAGGRRAATWVRWTGCLRRLDGEWLIVHDHVSVPLDMASGTALTGLEP